MPYSGEKRLREFLSRGSCLHRCALIVVVLVPSLVAPNRHNAFVAARTLGYDTLNVVFMDGHAVSDGIDEVWYNMFVKVFYIRHLTPKTCFERGIFISFGYARTCHLLHTRHPCYLGIGAL